MNAITLDQAIDTALQLPPDQQDMLIDILSKRRIEHSRHEIMTDARQSIADFRKGLFESLSVEEAVAELHCAVEDDE